MYSINRISGIRVIIQIRRRCNRRERERERERGKKKKKEKIKYKGYEKLNVDTSQNTVHGNNTLSSHFPRMKMFPLVA